MSAGEPVFVNGIGPPLQQIEEDYRDLNGGGMADDVRALIAEVMRLRAVIEDEAAMAEQTARTLQNLHDNWRTIIDEQDADGGPLIENLLYWLIDDLGGNAS